MAVDGFEAGVSSGALGMEVAAPVLGPGLVPGAATPLLSYLVDLFRAQYTLEIEAIHHEHDDLLAQNTELLQRAITVETSTADAACYSLHPSISDGYFSVLAEVDMRQ
ncbi:hypothetical protein ABZP36_001919 [Zizania latifolia]